MRRGPPSLRPPLLAWGLLTALTLTPLVLASLDPPPGTAFTGAFLSKPDFYNYLSYVQQAEDGASVFANKLILEENPRRYVNLEWWMVGRLSAAFGRRPLLAFKLVGLVASLALILLVDRWLVAAGLPEGHRLPSLLLVFTGGGLGGLRYLLLGPPAWRSLDLIAGLYPFIEVLANPHFVVGTTFVVAASVAFLEGRTALGLLAATLAGLCRPYDLVLIVVIRGLAVALTRPAREWAPVLAPLLALAPVGIYLYWVFFTGAQLGTFFYGGDYQPPPLLDFAVALGPAVGGALFLGWSRVGRDPAVVHLVSWALVGLALVLLQPVSFFLQFLTGIGIPLLGLVALGLGRFPPRVTTLAVLLFASTSVVALRIVLGPEPLWFVPRERLEVAHALRESCRAGGRLLSPPDVGLYAIAFTGCRAYVSERLRPPERDAETQHFYAASDPHGRSRLLDARCITHLVLPGPAEEIPTGWLGPGTPFRRIAEVGAGAGRIGAYARTGAAPCSAR